MELQEYRYPASALLKDSLGAVIGLTVFGAPALFVPLSSVMVLLLGGLGLLFAGFALRIVVRQQSRILLDHNGISVAGPIGRHVAWDDLTKVRLKFYSTWRDRTSGWMQLGVEGKGTAIRIDQSIDGFEHIARAVIDRAVAQNADFDAATAQNAGALGLDLPEKLGDRAE